MSNVIHAGTIGNFTDREFIEGTPQEIAAAKAKRAAETAILAARKRTEWREYPVDSLTFEGQYILVEADDVVLEQLRVEVWPPRSSAGPTPARKPSRVYGSSRRSRDRTARRRS